MSIIYGLAIDGFVRTVDPDTRKPFTLVTAMQAATGCGNAAVVKAVNGGGWKTVVERAGTMHDARHVATGLTLLRRRATGGPLWPRFGWNARRNYQRILEAIGR